MLRVFRGVWERVSGGGSCRCRSCGGCGGKWRVKCEFGCQWGFGGHMEVVWTGPDRLLGCT